MIKWHKTILKYKNKKIDFKNEIIQANIYKEWLVVATSNKIYFLGKNEIILRFPILSIQITKDYIIYHNKEDDNIYKINHPYDEEELIIYSPYYKFKYFFENEILILSNEKKIIIKHREEFYYLSLTDNENILEYRIDECSSSELYNTLDSSLDIKINNLSFDKIFNIFRYDNFIILNYESTIKFMFLEDNIFKFSESLCINENLEIIIILRLDISKDRSIEFLQINNYLFFGKKCLCKFTKNKFIKSFQVYKYNKNCFNIFWKNPDKLEKKILESMNTEEIIKIVINCIKTGSYNFVLFELDKYKINEIIEKKYLKSENIEIFISEIEKYEFLKHSDFYIKLKNLNMSNYKLSNTNIFTELLQIDYQRLFYYKNNMLKIKGSRNLAYKIIEYELYRENPLKKVRKCNFNSFYRKYFGDERMNEVLNLLNEPIRIFELDENDVEDIKERNYVMRLASNIGKSYCFYNNNFPVKITETDKISEPISFPLIKNGQKTKIELKNRSWKNWSSFFFGCLKIMSAKKNINISNILKMNLQDEYVTAGNLYGLGLKNKLKSQDFENLVNSVNKNNEILLSFIIISYGISNKNIRNINYEEYCFKQINIDQSFWIKIGSFIGLSNIFISTKNLKLKDLLIKEINKSGVFISDKYNKNNTIVYDRNYRIINTFNLAKVINYNNEFVYLNDKLCELILNGICLKDKTKFIKRFERFKGNSLEEIFYSNLFIEEYLDTKNSERSVLSSKINNKLTLNSKRFEDRLTQIETKINELTIWDIYKYSGIIFYYGINKKLSVTDRHILILNICKDKIKDNESFRILFDYLLITLCLFSNSECNLDLLKIIRQQLKKTEGFTFKEDRNNYIFTNLGIKTEIINELTYGDIEKYKICLGIISIGLCKYEIDQTKNFKLSLISTFYMNWPSAPYEQEFFNIFRLEIFNNIKKKKSIKFKEYFNSKYFKNEFLKLDDKDKKYVIDVLSDYYENYHDKEDYIINIEYFKDKVIRSN